jgi:hypothetical protein
VANLVTAAEENPNLATPSSDVVDACKSPSLASLLSDMTGAFLVADQSGLTAVCE